MNDKQMDTVLRTWLEEEAAQKPDRSRVVSNVVGQLGSARKARRRWWPFRRRSDLPPDTHDISEYQPAPIPAIGHSPTVTGRTQSMFSPVKAITAGALVFALGGVLLIAQPFDQQRGGVPGAATDDESMKPALVSGFLVWSEDSVSIPDLESYEVTTQDGIHREHWVEVDGASIDMSDSRLSGSITLDMFGDRFDGAGHPDTDVGWGTVRIENAAGVWEGRTVDTSDRAAGGRGIAYYELVGSGAYEGLSAIVFETENPQAETPEEEWAWSGIIFPGNLPPDR